MPEELRNGLNVLFVFFLVVVILIKFVPILRLLFLFILIVVFRDGIDLHGMDLNDFHLGFALGTRQDFAFFHFIFVDVNFSSAFRTPDHGENLLGERIGSPTASVLYNAKRAGREAAKYNDIKTGIPGTAWWAWVAW